MILDVQGIEVKVGDKVAFAGGGRGASEFYVGYVTKITNKGIRIEYKNQSTCGITRQDSDYLPVSFINWSLNVIRVCSQS